jgi:von Willebrand factor type A domain
MFFRQINKSILCLAIIIALSVDIGIIYFIYQTKIEFSPNQRSYFEKQAKPNSIQADFTKKEEISRRNEQLMAVFHQKPFDNTKTLKFELQAPKSEELVQPMSDFVSEIIIGKNNSDFDNLESNDHFDPSENLPLELGNKEISQEVSIPIKPNFTKTLFPNDEKLTNELVQASEMLQGKVENTSLENSDAIHQIKVGKLEETIIEGKFPQNRSGLNELEPTDITEGSEPSLLDFADLDENKTPIRQKTFQKGTTTNTTHLFQAIGKKWDDFFSMNSPLMGQIDPLNAVIASSDDFSVQVEYIKKITSNEYFFRLKLIQKEGISFKRIVQNVFFIIDRSHSIRENRYELTKAAVLKALTLLREGDSFNILIFDSSVSKLSKENLPWNKQNYSKAQEFLTKQMHGGFFASTDLYSSLDNIVPKAVAENEVNTAILLSDGDTYLTREQRRETINKWSQKNKGKVSLYSIASGKGNNLPLLDLLSTFNKGSLHYATNDSDLEKTLYNLMKSIRNPIGKEMVMTAIPPQPHIKLRLYPKNEHLPNLYEGTPYVVYGTINELKNFHLFFQGKYYDRWLDIKQIVSFDKIGPTKSSSLEKIWAIQEAYSYYDLYLKEGKNDYLQKAKSLLSPYKLQMALN